MKVARFFAVIFAVAGIVLMLGTCIVCFASVNSSVKITEYPDDAAACSEQLATALVNGDYGALEQLLYGKPNLGADDTSVSPGTALLWEAFRNHISFTYSANLYLLDSNLARDAMLTVPDVAAITEKLNARVRSLLEEQNPDAAQAGVYAPAAVELALQEALTQILREELPCVSHSVTIKFIHRDAQWWAVPDQTFLRAISGLQA